jgi:excisionase family DNA binding protein
MTKLVSNSPNLAFEAQYEPSSPLRHTLNKDDAPAVARKKPVQAEPNPPTGHQVVNSARMADDLIAIIAGKRGAWSASELAELLGCSGKHIYALAKTGRMPHLRIGGMIRFDPRTTATWLRERFIAA